MPTTWASPASTASPTSSSRSRSSSPSRTATSATSRVRGHHPRHRDSAALRRPDGRAATHGGERNLPHRRAARPRARDAPAAPSPTTASSTRLWRRPRMTKVVEGEPTCGTWATAARRRCTRTVPIDSFGAADCRLGAIASMPSDVAIVARKEDPGVTKATPDTGGPRLDRRHEELAGARTGPKGDDQPLRAAPTPGARTGPPRCWCRRSRHVRCHLEPGILSGIPRRCSSTVLRCRSDPISWCRCRGPTSSPSPRARTVSSGSAGSADTPAGRVPRQPATALPADRLGHPAHRVGPEHRRAEPLAPSDVYDCNNYEPRPARELGSPTSDREATVEGDVLEAVGGRSRRLHADHGDGRAPGRTYRVRSMEMRTVRASGPRCASTRSAPRAATSCRALPSTTSGSRSTSSSPWTRSRSGLRQVVLYANVGVRV